MSTPREFVQRIRVDGADKAVRDLRDVGDTTEALGKKTANAGGAAQNAGHGFDDLGDSASGAGRHIDSFVQGLAAGALGLEGILRVAMKFRAELERIVQLQRELANQSTGSLESVLDLAGQWKDLSQEGQERALRVATDVRKAAAMPSLASAAALVQAGDIALPGGTDPADPRSTPEAVARNLAITSAVGGAIPTGSVDTYSMVLEMLKTAGLTDPEQIKLELSRAFAVQIASLSDNLGAFLLGLNSPGLKDFLKGGGSVTDAAVLLLQAREASNDDATAITNMEIALRAARGSTATTKFLANKANEYGVGDFDMLTGSQRVQLLGRVFAEAEAAGPAAEAALLRQGFEPGQFPIIKSMFSTDSRAAAANARALAAEATAAEIDQKIRDFKESQIGKERQQAADIEYSEAIAGIDVYSIAKLRELAESRERIRLSRRGVTVGESIEVATTTTEAMVERAAMDILVERILQLESQGYDASGAVDAYNRAQRGTIWPFDEIGIKDSLLDQANEAVNRAIKEAVPAGGGNVTNNITMIGTNYAGPDPEANSPEYPDIGD